MGDSTNSGMKVFRTAEAMRAWSDGRKAEGRTIALVPTMGALHEGHLELVNRAASQCDEVIVSVFVNPTQFGPGEDFDAYPRMLSEDVERLRHQGLAGAVFAPHDDELYPAGEPLTWVTVDRLGDHLCGASREGHFRGVTTVVSKLFIVCRPDAAVFGLKDAQQFFILRRMARELAFGVKLIGVPTVREPDGLALSSRNKYLSDEERSEAVVLSRAVRAARDVIEGGERSAAAVRKAMCAVLEEAESGRVDYAEVVETDTLQPVQTLAAGTTVLAAVAVFFGQARLIDNAIVDVP